MRFASLATGCLIASILSATAAENPTYEIDPAHSSIQFKVRHFFNQVPGHFGEFGGTLTFHPDRPDQASAQATIRPRSINTANTKRDDHLVSDDYFDAEKHQIISFRSTKWKALGDNRYEVTGDLTMLGVTKPVTLQTVFLGEMPGIGPYSEVIVAGWQATGTIKRSEWGLTAGQPIVGDEVEIELSVQGHRPVGHHPKPGADGDH